MSWLYNQARYPTFLSPNKTQPNVFNSQLQHTKDTRIDRTCASMEWRQSPAEHQQIARTPFSMQDFNLQGRDDADFVPTPTINSTDAQPRPRQISETNEKLFSSANLEVVIGVVGYENLEENLESFSLTKMQVADCDVKIRNAQSLIEDLRQRETAEAASRQDALLMELSELVRNRKGLLVQQSFYRKRIQESLTAIPGQQRQ